MDRSPGRTRYFSSGGIFECSALLIISSATIVPKSILPNFNASNVSFWFVPISDGVESFGWTTNTNYGATSTCGPTCIIRTFLSHS